LRRRLRVLRFGFSIDGSLYYGDLPALDGVRVRHIARRSLREILRAPDTAGNPLLGTRLFALVLISSFRVVVR